MIRKETIEVVCSIESIVPDYHQLAPEQTKSKLFLMHVGRSCTQLKLFYRAKCMKRKPYFHVLHTWWYVSQALFMSGP